ncbi:sulfite exporter TauE/SafE family protein [Bradyrhizobium sp. 180]|uniref:sulfite exporter TauE/SafE family protein n=1 Tax=Bradyrhizobium sp. 180 TaxID=2782650 RepID=UPI001FF8CEEA|nr:sulfite exporter TauE/SafE family protein [Bradyrhizobium sp. 180]MCK1492471.1 sulfite exporter TauE/SafE family protein [Bradyrhizobium sp. 180]
MSSAISFDLAIFLLGTFAAAFVTGLAGFAFGMVAAGIWLFALTPVQTTTLILAYALLVQGYSTWRLRRTILPSRLLPFVVGSAVGIPVGIVVLEFASALHLRTAVGLLLTAFSLYNLLRPKMPDLKGAGRTADAGIGFVNGVLGGSTGLGGILPTLWCVMRGWPRDEHRSVSQPTAVAPSPYRYWPSAGWGSLPRKRAGCFWLVFRCWSPERCSDDRRMALKSSELPAGVGESSSS